MAYVSNMEESEGSAAPGADPLTGQYDTDGDGYPDSGAQAAAPAKKDDLDRFQRARKRAIHLAVNARERVTEALDVPGALAKTEAATTALQGQTAPTIQAAQAQGTQLDPAQEAFRQQQMQLSNALMMQSQGLGGPSAAQGMLQQGLDAGMRQQLAMAASTRGMPQSAAMRQAGYNMGEMSQQTAAQSATLRAQEKLAAQQQLGGLLAQGRGADIDFAGKNAGLTQEQNIKNAELRQQAAMGNQAATLELQKQVNALTQSYLAMGFAQEQALAQAMLAIYGTEQGAFSNIDSGKMGYHQAVETTPSAGAQIATAATGGLASGLGAGLVKYAVGAPAAEG